VKNPATTFAVKSDAVNQGIAPYYEPSIEEWLRNVVEKRGFRA
jgi:hypothetical protein